MNPGWIVSYHWSSPLRWSYVEECSWERTSHCQIDWQLIPPGETKTSTWRSRSRSRGVVAALGKADEGWRNEGISSEEKSHLEICWKIAVSCDADISSFCSANKYRLTALLFSATAILTCMSWGRWDISSPIGTGGCRNQWQKWAEQLGNRVGHVVDQVNWGYKIDDSDCNQKLCCRVHIALGSRIFFDFLQDGNSGKKTHSEHFLDGKQLQVGFWEAHHLRNGCFTGTSWKDDVCVCLSKKLYAYIYIYTKWCVSTYSVTVSRYRVLYIQNGAGFPPVNSSTKCWHHQR